MAVARLASNRRWQEMSAATWPPPSKPPARASAVTGHWTRSLCAAVTNPPGLPNPKTRRRSLHHKRRYPVAMESSGHPVRQLDAGHVL